jgi:drug/metabolite transporter (DMT)-like permease
MSGILAGLLSAALFGASTPISKVFLSSLTPFQLAGLLYLGAALGTFLFAATSNPAEALRRVDRRNWLRLGGATLFGGCLAPVLVLLGLRLAGAGSVSLMLNLEIAATAALGVVFFREHIHARGVVGILGVFGVGVLLAGGEGAPGPLAGLAVAGACLAWGIDNNLTALIDGITPSGTAFFKGMIGGVANLTIGLLVAPLDVTWMTLALVLLVGALSYGASIVLYISSAQQLGATRAQGLFASAPFIGAILSFAFLREALSPVHLVAAALLIASVVLIMRSEHVHAHVHEPMEHVHRHRHDDHHQHEHVDIDTTESHMHVHLHEELVHVGGHYSDLHHRHSH